MSRVVEVQEVTGGHVHGADAEARLAGIDAIEVDQALECGLERRRIVVACRLGAAGWLKPGARHSGRKKASCPAEQSSPGAQLIQQSPREFATRDRWRHGEPRNAVPGPAGGNELPELTQLLDPCRRRISGYQGCVHRADTDTRAPPRPQMCFRECLVNTRLISP